MFDGILGQERPKALLAKLLDEAQQDSRQKDRIGCAYLFAGPQGTGKKLMANEFIRHLFCATKSACGVCPGCLKLAGGNHPDLFSVTDDGDSLKIATVRAIQEDLRFHPLEAPRKVCLVEGAERFTQEAQSAFLKTLEEPRDDTLFLLLTDNPEALLATIRSRCQIVRFERVLRSQLAAWLQERCGISASEARVEAAIAGGSPGKALAHIEEMRQLARATAQDGGKKRGDHKTDSEGSSAEDPRVALIREVAALPPAEENVVPLFKLTEKLAQKPGKADNLKMLLRARLEILQTFFGDMLKIRAGQADEELVNMDLAELIRTRAARESIESLIAKLGLLEETRRALDDNTNARLTLDLLLMQLADLQLGFPPSACGGRVREGSK